MVRQLFLNASVIAISALVSLIGAEYLSRHFFAPVDFLLPRLESDPILGHRIMPGSGGHDQHGFRNSSVPDRAEIIAIGDSMTYGMAATSNESWPSQLSKITDETVYNMALGGYGALQYLHLLETQALSFSPQRIVMGLYLGNDLMDSYNLAYSNDYWAPYRNDVLRSNTTLDLFRPAEEAERRLLGGLRNWLAERVVLYRVLTQSVLGDRVRVSEIEEMPEVVELHINDEAMYFLPNASFIALDLDDARVAEGLRITLKALEKAQDFCRSAGIDFLVVLIPTKESVYADRLLARVGGDNNIVQQLIHNETEARRIIISHLSDSGIDFVDVLPVLREAARIEAVYPAFDSHPNGRGYAELAEKIATHLSVQSSN